VNVSRVLPEYAYSSTVFVCGNMFNGVLQVAKHLPGSLVFHNNPPSTSRPRHRNRAVASQLARDSHGREHLLLNFYVQALPAGSTQSYIESAQGWLDALPNVSFDEARDWARVMAIRTVDSTKDLFRYLTGDSVPSRNPGLSIPSKQVEQRHEERQGLWGSITGVFGSLRSTSRNAEASGSNDAVAGKWQEGEVHVDLVKVRYIYFPKQKYS
jgi:mitochondrial import inner membrane translocase subunit TIM21